MEKTLKKHADKIRFGFVGVINTFIDWVIFFSLVYIGIPTIVSNYISTSIALTFSFFANKTFAFKHEAKTTHRSVILFIAITLIGLWAIQPIIIEFVNIALGSWFTESQFVSSINDILGSWFKPIYLVLFLAKGLASAASMIWNYVFYKKYVFKKPD